MTPEQKRIELLEARVKSLEETLLYVSNTLGMKGMVESFELNPARETYYRGQVAQEELIVNTWDWQE